jgi:uracil-DNA glycosylase|tara:strand:+ start:46 stop:288 length:243 start_codon:yes stop_codon:yes gene_type:complete
MFSRALVIELLLLFGAPAAQMFYKYYIKRQFFKLQDHYLKPKIYETKAVFVLPHPTSMVSGKSQIYDQTFKGIDMIIKKS